MLAQIVGRLLAAADQPNTQFTVTILDSAEVNAFALPGGYIYVTRGILALANDTERARGGAGARDRARHAEARARPHQPRPHHRDRRQGGDRRVRRRPLDRPERPTRRKLSLAAFSQQQELAADKEGILIAGKAGFDPHAAARFLGAMGRFAQFSAGDADQGDDFLSSHPSTPDRIQKATENARAFFGAPGIGETRRAPNTWRRSTGMLFGDSPHAGRDRRPALHPSDAEVHLHGARRTTRCRSRRARWWALPATARRCASTAPRCPTTMALADYLKSGWIAGLQARDGQAQQPERLRHGVRHRRDRPVELPRRGGALRGPRLPLHLRRRASTASCSRAAAAATLKSFRAATASRPPAGPLADDQDRHRRRRSTPPTRWRARWAPDRGRANLFYILNNLYPGRSGDAGRGVQDRRRAVGRRARAGTNKRAGIAAGPSHSAMLR